MIQTYPSVPDLKHIPQGERLPPVVGFSYYLVTPRHHEGGPTHTPDRPPVPQENLSRGPGSSTGPSGSSSCEEIRPA